jgi:protein TonB
MEAAWNNVTSDSRNDIVFGGRNQEYGAFELRRNYNRNVMMILFGIIAFIALGMGVKFVMGLKSEEPVKVAELDMTQIDLTPPPLDKNEPPPPPPPPPPVMETVKFVPPVIKDDAVETDPPPPQEKLAETNVATETHEGDGDAVVIPEGNGNGVVEEKAPEIFTVVEEMPEFPGGTMEMMKYIQKNIQYPAMAREAGISGKCFLKFVVNGDGAISDVQILKSVAGCPDCDKEAMRVVKSMPKWKAGKQNGRAVSVFFNLPINFTIK